MSKVYRDIYGCEIPDPEPVDEQPEPEIRGGNRREDFIPVSGMFSHHENDDTCTEDDEGYGEGDGDEE